MYAEGDHLDVSHSAASYLKKSLFEVVSMFEIKKSERGAATEPEIKEPLPPSKQDLNRISSKSKKIKKNAKQDRRSSESEYEVTQSEHTDQEEVFNQETDVIRKTEISDSSAESQESENEDFEDFDESFRVIDSSLLYFVFESVIKKYYRHKKAAKEA